MNMTRKNKSKNEIVDKKFHQRIAQTCAEIIALQCNAIIKLHHNRLNWLPYLCDSHYSEKIYLEPVVLDPTISSPRHKESV